MYTYPFALFLVLSVDYLLKNTDIKVVVYQGQLDIICDTAGRILDILFT